MLRVFSKTIVLKFLILFLIVTSLTYSPGHLWAKKKPKDAQASSSQDLTSLIISGQYDKAFAQLKSSKNKKSKGRWEHRLQFMAAYLHLQAGEYKKAAEIFKKLRKDYSLLKDYIEFYLALAMREDGKANQAVSILTELKTKSTSPHLTKKIDRELALSYCKTGDRGTAVDMLNGMIQMEKSDIQAYHLRFDRSQCLIDLGYPDEALVSLRSLYLNYPEGDLSEKILNTLKKIGKAKGIGQSDHVRRGDQLMVNNRPKLAAMDFAAVVENYGSRAPGALQKKLAEAYFKSRQYPKAAEAYEKIRDQHPGLYDAKTQMRLAQSYSRSDQFNKAIRAYEDMRVNSPSSQQPRLDYKIAFLHMDKGDYRKANQLFEEILNQYPKHRRRSQIYWFLAWNNYLLNDYGNALQYLNILEEEFSKSRHAKRVPYWRARIMEKQGKKKAAQAQYQAIAERNPFSYYGFVSLKRLENNWNPRKPPKNSWATDLPRFRVPAPFSLSGLQPGGKKSIQRVKELLLLGLWEDFLGELDYLTYGEGISGDLANLKSGLSGRGNREAVAYSNQGWRNRYPAAYATLVSLFSKTRNFPMALTWAIMREESRFRPSVVSPAQAIGLMQIIPPTGLEIAQDLGREGFVPEWLYQPVTNIEYGVHYLNKNLNRFDGKLPQTIASYNAGPNAVSRWMKARPGREWDEFIEEIPYKETNNYVKKVLKSYYIYNLLYNNP